MILSLTQVACARGGRLLFARLSLDLAPGGAVIVTGPNGIGKSSLLRLAAGLLAAFEGGGMGGAPGGLMNEDMGVGGGGKVGEEVVMRGREDGGGGVRGGGVEGCGPRPRH